MKDKGETILWHRKDAKERKRPLFAVTHEGHDVVLFIKGMTRIVVCHDNNRILLHKSM